MKRGMNLVVLSFPPVVDAAVAYLLHQKWRKPESYRGLGPLHRLLLEGVECSAFSLVNVATPGIILGILVWYYSPTAVPGCPEKKWYNCAKVR